MPWERQIDKIRPCVARGIAGKVVGKEAGVVALVKPGGGSVTEVVEPAGRLQLLDGAPSTMPGDVSMPDAFLVGGVITDVTPGTEVIFARTLPDGGGLVWTTDSALSQSF